MRFCLRARQSKEYLKKADELLVEYRDNNYIYDLVEINPNAIITLEINSEENLTLEDWEKLNQYKIICKNGFRLMLTSLLHMSMAKQMGYNFFCSIPIYDTYHLNAFIEYGVCAIRIDGKLAHQLDLVKSKNIETRVIVNNANGYLNHHPIITGWFRPEDIMNLPIDVCEFKARDNRQEQALYRIYAEKHEWSGALADIIDGINDKDIMNRMIPPEFQERRSNCGLHCEDNSSCHYCERICNIAKMQFIKQVKNNNL